ncbi:hypothetical protein O181_070096 [Austropuccinia psidii MF-1]|uniref:Uncharacterized protein n=1 Tax=Austropuccinia psidii MF-1 TaxID=1389203 RepID=A0A9Q3I5D4_9BASI|nr:hypothetical protein [Austropuccinia psidii MF-1]
MRILSYQSTNTCPVNGLWSSSSPVKNSKRTPYEGYHHFDFVRRFPVALFQPETSTDRLETGSLSDADDVISEYSKISFGCNQQHPSVSRSPGTPARGLKPSKNDSINSKSSKILPLEFLSCQSNRAQQLWNRNLLPMFRSLNKHPNNQKVRGTCLKSSNSQQRTAKSCAAFDQMLNSGRTLYLHSLLQTQNTSDHVTEVLQSTIKQPMP